jgi:serine/threonine protein kinase
MSAFLDSGRRYELCGLLGRGGLGEVLLATDTQLDRKVAIKRLYQDPEASAETAAAAIREARVLASLLHPNVVAVFDIFEFLGDVLVVMEYVPGRTLQEIGDFAPMALQDFVTVATQSLRGLAAAHELTLLHCDIKPSNIMVSSSAGGWKVKVLDFGLARLAEVTQSRTPDDQERELLGSIYTMAPEQFEENPVDVRTDLYSLGCVLYFVLAGAYPFVGESVEDVVNAHLSHTLIPVAEARPDLPEPLADWVMKLMEKNPDARFPDAYEALDELRLILKHPALAT